MLGAVALRGPRGGKLEAAHSARGHLEGELEALKEGAHGLKAKWIPNGSEGLWR